MKTTKILGATTIAGALLFTGLGNADAAESEVTSNNASNIATNVLKKAGQSPENVNFQDAKDKGDYYFLSYGNKSGVGVGGVRVYKDGTVSSTSGIRGADDNGEYFEKDGKYEFAKIQNSQDNNQIPQNTGNTETMQNNEQQQLEATESTKAENNTQSQNQSQALPETGEESSNTTLVTMIASVILAAGSLLTFKRFSKTR